MPDAALVQRCLLFALLDGVVAGLAEGLKIAFIPEQTLIASVWLDVVAHQERGITLQPSACLVLADVEIAKEDAQPQRAPACRLVPLLPGGTAQAAPAALRIRSEKRMAMRQNKRDIGYPF